MESNFKISPRVLAHLGEDLIKSESIALLELVKNSYDAWANNCLVYFNFENNKLKEIIIKDDGYGMDHNIIQNVWLVVGTDNKYKKIENHSRGRVPLGEKGIGRLGAHKLGNRIQLVSKTINADEVELLIDWTKLEESENIEDFKIIVNKNNTPKYFKNTTGTFIKITDLKTTWNKRQLREIYRAVNSLNSPFDVANKEFKAVIRSNTDVFKGLPDYKDIKNAALYFAKCKIENDKIIKFKYEFKPWSSLAQIQDKRIKTIKDFDEFQLKLSKSKGRKPIALDLSVYKIGPIEFEIAIFDFDSQIFNYVNVEKKSVKNYLKENGGIRVYRDGIRVYDYGEKENDWLGIDLKRVHHVGGNISNHIVIGAVKLDRIKSKDLKEKTNREGFVENEAYQAFADAVNYALDLIVSERNIDKSRLSTLYKRNKTIEPVLSDLDEVITIVENTIRKKETKEEILKYLYRINDQYKEVKEVLIRSANAGLNLSVIIHEIEKLVAGLVGSIRNNKFNKAINITLQLEKIVQGYSVMIKSSQIKKEKLSKVVNIALDNYEFRFDDHKISVVSNYKENDLNAYYAKSEAVSVLTNLLDNSIFWLSYSRTKDRKISVYITDQIKNYHSIIVSDNGPGFKIPTDVAVKPFITGKPNSIGSGLGLHITDEMMKAMKGQLIFLDKNDIELPKKIKESIVTKAIVALCFPKEKGDHYA